MNDSESEFMAPRLPPRRSSSGADKNKQDAENNIPEQDPQSSFDDIDPELLAAFEHAVKETPSEVEIDLTIPSPSTRVTAPLIEDYIDPFAVPIDYLLEQARMAAQADEMEGEGAEINLDELDKKKK